MMDLARSSLLLSASVNPNKEPNLLQKTRQNCKRSSSGNDQLPDDFPPAKISRTDFPLPPTSNKKTISPFAPEARVPLPSELEICSKVHGTIGRRNERERQRVRHVNGAYEELWKQLPFSESDRKLSKVETLRMAICYIKHLGEMSEDQSHVCECNCFYKIFGSPDGNEGNTSSTSVA